MKTYILTLGEIAATMQKAGWGDEGWTPGRLASEFINKQNLEVVSVGFDPQGFPATFVLRGEGASILRW